MDLLGALGVLVPFCYFQDASCCSARRVKRLSEDRRCNRRRVRLTLPGAAPPPRSGVTSLRQSFPFRPGVRTTRWQITRAFVSLQRCSQQFALR